MNRKTRTKPQILFLGAFPPPMGGIGNQAQLLLDSFLFNNSFNVIPIKTNPHRTYEQPERKCKWLSLWSFKFLYHVTSTAIQLRPDVVFLRANGDISLIRNGIVAIIASKLSRSPLVMYIHIAKTGSWARKSRFNGIGDRILAYIVKQSDILIHLSEAANQAFISRGWPCANFIIPNAVMYKDKLNKKEKNPGSFYFVGRLSEAKGFFDILNALRNLNVPDIEWTFHVMGKATTETNMKKIESIIEGHPFNKHIIIHGLTLGAEKDNIIQECSFIIFPSHKENFPNAILEALATGQAIISTDVGEISKMIDSKGWLSVEIGNIEGIRRNIELLLSNRGKTEAMGRINRISSKKYALATISEKICSIIESLVE